MSEFRMPSLGASMDAGTLVSWQKAPGDVLHLKDRADVDLAGFVTELGGPTSHTAILARSLKVPAVVGLRDLSRRVSPGTAVVIDGTAGTVTLDPSPADIEDARRQAPARRRAASGASPTAASAPAATITGPTMLTSDSTYASRCTSASP